MTKLELHLNKGNVPELYRVSFYHSLLNEPRNSFRGKATGGLDSQLTFQWTPAVQALVIFLLENAACEIQGIDQPKLSGTKSSLAATLDYAISKQPQWILDIFGSDRKGRSLLRKLIRRSNPERKRPGPVVLTLNQAALCPKNISVFLDGAAVTEGKELQELSSRIRFNCNKSPLLFVNEQSSVVKTNKLLTIKPEVLKQLIFSEATNMLWRTDVFSSKRQNTAQHKILTSPSVQSRVSSKTRFWSELDESLNSAQRLGMGMHSTQIRRLLTPDQAIRVTVPWIEITPLVLFEYLKREKRYNLELDYEWAYTAEVRRALVSGSIEPLPDLCVLGIGPATTAIKQSKILPYGPLMLLPNISHRVITHKSASTNSSSLLSRGEYNFLCEEASTPEFCFEAMERCGTVNRKKVAISHIEPDDAFRALREGNPDLRMLMFFPHYSVNELFNNCKAISIPGLTNDMQESVLFAHSTFLANKDRCLALNIALRNAWLELREKPHQLSALVSDLVEEPHFMQFFTRFTGMYSQTQSCN